MQNVYLMLKRIEVSASLKVRKTAKIRKRYDQVPHLAQDNTWESNKNLKLPGPEVIKKIHSQLNLARSLKCS